ncbi:hypothetical protein DH2020_003937 [Rehmannia glutinosa]|uniref:Xylulose kinase n=1 Tax=Rehmannia glutinosa TaxID=99300 RepID=A0ABR0XN38_REHGL
MGFCSGLVEGCSLPQDSLFLGFDCSTQSLKATVLDANLKIFATEVVTFDKDLPHYKTKDGVYRDPLVNGRIVSPTLMWVEALDVILQRLDKSKLDFGKIIAISGSAQQHGSVYWKNGSYLTLASLDSEKPLVDQLGEAFSIKESPIWMDCSTTEQCRAIEKAVGGALELSKLTGSCAHERYVGPQIRKIFETQPEVYNNTERISLISSFMASLLIGGYACIDHTDGAGMNLMDIKLRAWSKIALEATAPNLEKKLGNLAPAHAVAGFISNYYVERLVKHYYPQCYRYHFKRNCLVIQWSGDNPNSLAVLPLEPSFFGSLYPFDYPGVGNSAVIHQNLGLLLVTNNFSYSSKYATLLNHPSYINNSDCSTWSAVLSSRRIASAFVELMGSYGKERGDLQSMLSGEDSQKKKKMLSGEVLLCKTGLTLNTPGDLAISLGTSDTVFGIAKDHQPSLDGHTFPDPVDTEDYMVMLVYKNGSLTREDIRNRRKDRLKFVVAYPVGEHRYVLENFESDSLCGLKEHGDIKFDAASEVRALIEGQLLSMRAHAEKIGMPSPPRRIIATGGASANKCILSLIASIFGCDVYTVERSASAIVRSTYLTCSSALSDSIHSIYAVMPRNMSLMSYSASLGAALRAAHGWLCHEKGGFVPMKYLYMDKLEKTSLNCKLSVAAGDKELVAKYTLLMKKRVEIENELVQKLGRI